MPVIAPVAEFKVNPAGNVPAVTLKLVPPVALTWKLTDVPPVNVGGVVELIVGAGGMYTGALGDEIVPLNVWLDDPYVVVAVTVNEYVPAVVGVPVMAPVAGSSVNPAGSVPPLIVKEVPPETGRVTDAALPVVSVPRLEELQDGIPTTTVPVNLRDAFPDSLVAVIVKS